MDTDYIEARAYYYRKNYAHITMASAYELARRDMFHVSLWKKYKWMREEGYKYQSGFIKPLVPYVHNYIIFKPLFDDIRNLDQETLHASYVSLLAQYEQKQVMASIKLLKNAQESYYHKYGRWYDKFISYLK